MAFKNESTSSDDAGILIPFGITFHLISAICLILRLLAQCLTPNLNYKSIKLQFHFCFGITDGKFFNYNRFNYAAF